MNLPKRYLLCLLALGACLMACHSPQPEETAPNILIILADDLGYGDLSCLNPDSKIPTPNMDRLASEGMLFTDMHSPSAVCTPTRYGLLTGRYCWRTRLKSGVLVGHDPALIAPGRLTIGSLLQQQGYHTACIGKWHLGLNWVKKDPERPLTYGLAWQLDSVNVDYSQGVTDGPNSHGFDYSYIIPSSLDIQPYAYLENHQVLGLPMKFTEGVYPDKAGRGVFWRYGDVASDFVFEEVLDQLTAKAVSYLEGRADKPEQPFMLYFPLTAPHTPWLPTKEVRGASGAGRYGDFVVQVDRCVGRVLDALDRLQLSSNTLVILTSDNGADWRPSDIEAYGHLANYHFRGRKADIWEAGHRVPFLLRWPGKVMPGSSSPALACLTDLMATFADMHNRRLPEGAGEDSYSLLPALDGKQQPDAVRPDLIHHSLAGKFAIRKDEWKLIPSRGSGGFSQPKNYEPKEGEAPGQLYNLAQDIGENDNLYLQAPRRVAQLEQLLRHYQQTASSRPEPEQHALPPDSEQH